MYVLGVDGCRAGWIAATKRDGRLDCHLYAAFQDLLDDAAVAERIFIDIPIGLPSRAQPARQCDAEARAVLGPRRSSDFTPPCRSACHARHYQDAQVINRRELGRGLSIQAWGICTKIAEVDQALQQHAWARNIVREIHPEVCFWALANAVPMAHPKRTPAGMQARVELLTRFEPQTSEVLDRVLTTHRRRAVQADDVLDAIAAYVTAAQDVQPFQTLPERPQTDETGLLMQITYSRTTH